MSSSKLVVAAVALLATLALAACTSSAFAPRTGAYRVEITRTD